MRDRIAIHWLIDKVLDEVDKGENFVDLEISSMSIEIRAQGGKFECGKPYDINMEYSNGSSFTMDDADLLIKKLDGIADANPHD